MKLTFVQSTQTFTSVLHLYFVVDRHSFLCVWTALRNAFNESFQRPRQLVGLCQVGQVSWLVGLWDTLSSEAKKVVWISPPVPSRLSFCLARYETVLKSPFVHPDSIVLQCCYKVMMKVLLWGWMESQSWHWLCTAYLILCKGLLPLLAWVVLFYYLPFDCKYILLLTVIYV